MEDQPPASATRPSARLALAAALVALAALVAVTALAVLRPGEDDHGRDDAVGDPDRVIDTGTGTDEGRDPDAGPAYDVDFDLSGARVGPVDLAGARVTAYRLAAPGSLGVRAPVTRYWYCPVEVRVRRETARVVELAVGYQNLRPDIRSCPDVGDLRVDPTPRPIRLERPLGSRRVLVGDDSGVTTLRLREPGR